MFLASSGSTSTPGVSGSVLLAGLAIVTWCFGILHTILGPGLHAVKTSIANRLGIALGPGLPLAEALRHEPSLGSVPRHLVDARVLERVHGQLRLAGHGLDMDDEGPVLVVDAHGVVDVGGRQLERDRLAG